MYYIGHIIRVLCCLEGNIRLSNFTGPINEYIYRVYDIKKIQMLFICLKDGQQNLRRSFNHLVSSIQNIM